MKRKIFILGLILSLCVIGGCATNINRIAENYAEDTQAIKDFARISSENWLFGSGIIQGSLPESVVPAWVFEELQLVDSWFKENQELDDWHLGYIIGLRIRLATPTIKGYIQEYAPGILGIRQVAMVLAFIGL